MVGVTAATGIAATHIGGSTLHSVMGCGCARGRGRGWRLGQRHQRLLPRVRQRACCRAHGPPWPQRHALLAHLLHPPFLTPACRTRPYNARLLHPPFQRPPAAPALTLPTCRTRLL